MGRFRQLYTALTVVGMIGSYPVLCRAEKVPVNAYECHELLVGDSLRFHIQQVRHKYLRLTNSSSPELGNEFRQLPLKSSPDHHILSLGSGPDVFRPLYDFPKAGHIHLVDTFEGLDQSENEVRAEINSRLTALGDGVAPVLIKSEFNEQVWHVRWGPDRAKRKTYFHLHSIDYNNSRLVDNLLWRIPPGHSIGGILTNGAPLPSKRSLDMLLDVLEPGGSFIAVHFEPARLRFFAALVGRYGFDRLSRMILGDEAFLSQKLKSLNYNSIRVSNENAGQPDGIFSLYSYIYLKPPEIARD